MEKDRVAHPPALVGWVRFLVFMPLLRHFCVFFRGVKGV